MYKFYITYAAIPSNSGDVTPITPGLVSGWWGLKSKQHFNSESYISIG